MQVTSGFNFSQSPRAVSAGGSVVAFSSSASNLVSGDTNGAADVFVNDRGTKKPSTTRVSVASGGAQANGDSGSASVSGDGRLVAFVSGASNLASGDTNGVADVFVHDRVTNSTTRVSVASDGTEANAESAFVGAPQLSVDGRFVAFESFASNLVLGDTNGMLDIFVHDRQTGAVTRASVASDGTQANNTSRSASISGDGRFVAFHSFATNLVPPDTNPDFDIFVHDQQTGTTSLANVASDGTQANSSSVRPSISGDGRFVSFDSTASNLVPGDTNGIGDVFVHQQF
jgi:hypothetical protein